MANPAPPNASAAVTPSGYEWPSESILRVAPFVVRRMVKWHECDPAGVVYAGNFVTYASSASHMFLGHLLGGRFHEKKREIGIDFPAKGYHLVFYSSLWPDQYFDMTVSVVRIGRASFTNQIVGTSLTGEPVFVAQMTPICVVPGGPKGRQSVPIPDRLRKALQDHINPTPHPMDGGA
jgi:acyl-CoA thioester hydrolase